MHIQEYRCGLGKNTEISLLRGQEGEQKYIGRQAFRTTCVHGKHTKKQLWERIECKNTVFGGARNKETKILGMPEHINTVAGERFKINAYISI